LLGPNPRRRDCSAMMLVDRALTALAFAGAVTLMFGWWPA
jgi:hypothetical protein